MYRKISKIMSLTMILCLVVVLLIPSCKVKAIDITMQYTSYEVLQWILMELGISASLSPEKQQFIVLPDGQEITKPNLGAELIREVNDSIELWWNANQMDDVVDGYDGGLEQFKTDFADMLEWGRDGVIEITENMWGVMSDWGKSLNEYLQSVKTDYYDTSHFILRESCQYSWESPKGWGESMVLTLSAPVFVVELDYPGRSFPVWYSSQPFTKTLGSKVYSSELSKYGFYYFANGAVPFILNIYGIPHISVTDYSTEDCISRIMNGELPIYMDDVIWQPTDLKSDICGIPWELPDSIPYPQTGDATITIPQDLPIDDVITGVGTGELTWEDVIGRTFPIPIDKPIDKPAEGDTETDTEKDTEKETESEKEIEWDDTIFAPEGAIGGKLSELSKKFPFCIPFDVVALFKGFGKDVVETAPRWEVSIDMPFIDYTWIVVIDMKDYEKYVKIFRDGFYLLFLVGLFFTTRKLISWQID